MENRLYTFGEVKQELQTRLGDKVPHSTLHRWIKNLELIQVFGCYEHQDVELLERFGRWLRRGNRVDDFLRIVLIEKRENDYANEC